MAVKNKKGWKTVCQGQTTRHARGEIAILLSVAARLEWYFAVNLLHTACGNLFFMAAQRVIHITRVCITVCEIWRHTHFPIWQIGPPSCAEQKDFSAEKNYSLFRIISRILQFNFYVRVFFQDRKLLRRCETSRECKREKSRFYLQTTIAWRAILEHFMRGKITRFLFQ